MASTMSIAQVEMADRRTEENDDYANRPIDLVHLSHYTLGDSTLEREILQLFRAQSRIYLDRLHAADAASAWREAAHTIKGSARGTGAWKVAECAEKAERCKSGKNQKVLGQLESALNETNSFIKSILADH